MTIGNHVLRAHDTVAGWSPIVGGMHEGKKLETLLDARNIGKAEFGRACGVGPSAVQKMLKAVEWKPGMWATIASGMEKIKIDPGELRGSVVAFRERPAQDLRPLVDAIPAPALTALRTLLGADDRERQRVLDYLDGLLRGTAVK